MLQRSLSEYGVALTKAIKDILGIETYLPLKVAMSTTPMLLAGMRSGYLIDELLAPAPCLRPTVYGLDLPPTHQQWQTSRFSLGSWNLKI